MSRRTRRKTAKPPARGRPPRAGALRIIGGSMRGRRLRYSGDPRTRPMKDRVREAVFNLVRDAIAGRQTIDLFAGTGALGLEAISRGASDALLIEQHAPTAAIIRQNVQQLGLDELAHVLTVDAFVWAAHRTRLSDAAWLVFCSPPFDFYVERQDAMLRLIADLVERAPAGSTFVVECDERFAINLLPDASRWDIRLYPPAVIAIYRKTESPMTPPVVQRNTNP